MNTIAPTIVSMTSLVLLSMLNMCLSPGIEDYGNVITFPDHIVVSPPITEALFTQEEGDYHC